MVYGLKTAPAIWQKLMDNLLKGLNHTACYLDNIIVTGFLHEDYLINLNRVFAKLNDAGIKLNKDKCKFFQKEVKYCGHIISEMGLKKSPDNIIAIKNAPCPINI